MKNRPVTVLLSAALISSLLLLNFTVVKLNVSPVLNAASANEAAASGRPTTLSLLIREAHDSQDPETTACRYALRQIIRMSEPLSALLALSGTMTACLPVYTAEKSALLSGACVPRNAERIAVFLHDLSAAL